MCINHSTKGTRAVSLILKELIDDNVLQQHSFRGIKRKDIVNIRFDKYTNFLGTVYKMFEFATNKLKRLSECPSRGDVEDKVSEYIRHAKERNIKKAAAKEKSNNERSQSESSESDSG